MVHASIAKKIMGLIFLMSLTAALSACATQENNKSQGTVSIQDPGQEVFLNNCVSCHMGAGDPPAPNEKILQSKKLSSEAAFRAYVRQPDNGMMPPFSTEMLSDADIKLLYAYVSKQK